MDYWAETMQDDAYLIADSGWKAETYRVIERRRDKNGKETAKDKGWACDLVPKELIVARYFAKEAAKIADMEAERGARGRGPCRAGRRARQRGWALFRVDRGWRGRCHRGGCEGAAERDQGDRSTAEEATALNAWLDLAEREKELKQGIKAAEAALDDAARQTYPKLTEAEVKALVVDDKWMAKLEACVAGETARVAQTLTRRVKELGDRYGTTMQSLADR